MSADDWRPPAGGAYLVVLKNDFFAADLAEAIREGVPGATVLVAHDCRQAMALLDGTESVAMAFVHARPEGFETSPLGQAITLRGGRVVLMGDEAEARGEAQGYAVLHRPFTTETVLVLVRSRKDA